MTILTEFKQVLVFAAHPDDEVIGCGGTLRKLADLGAVITVVIATSGDTGVSPAFLHLENIPETRQLESKKTKELLGIDRMIFLGHQTQQLANDQLTFHQCIRLVRQLRPDLVLTHHPNDKHRDHRVLADLTREAVWKAWENVMPDLGERHRVTETWLYEITDTFATPDIVIDIGASLKTKLAAMAVHVSQQEVMAGIAHYLKGLAQVRGFMLECEYGEAFQTCNILPRMG
ncbi:MAG: PIG-L deacetylase family protein [Chloroflexota bacterium]